MKHRVALTSVCLVALASSACANNRGADSSGGGDAWEPSGDVTMVIPFGAGGGSDNSGRLVASALEAETGVNINVENREGGSGAVGYSYFLSKKGNAETLLATETALLALPTTGDVEFTYKDFTPIGKIAEDFTLLVVPASSPYTDCAQVAEAAKSTRVVAGISGKTGLDNVVFSLTEKETGATFDRVVFESGAELLAALLGGQIDIASLNPGEVLGQLESGDIKALCAFSENRYEYGALKDIPTASEQGIDVSFAQFRGVLAPGGITDAQRQYWIDAMEEMVTSQAYKDYISDNYLQQNVLTGDDFTDYLGENQKLLEQALEES